jgi:hypothetical protein
MGALADRRNPKPGRGVIPVRCSVSRLVGPVAFGVLICGDRVVVLALLLMPVL